MNKIQILLYLIIYPVCYAAFQKYVINNHPGNSRYLVPAQQIQGLSVEKCLLNCNKSLRCKAANYNNETQTCELVYLVPQTQIPNTSSEHVQKWKAYTRADFVPAISAWQSTTYVYNGQPLPAENAIDGNLGKCAHTANHYSYLALELERPIYVYTLMVLFNQNVSYNYRNRDLEFLVSTTRANSDNNIGEQCANYTGPPAVLTTPIVVTCNKPVFGKFVKVIHHYPHHLVLCEVDVYSTL